MAEQEPMSYDAVQDYVELVTSVVRNLELETFVRNAENALKVGPFVDAKLAAETRPKLELIRDSAQLLLQLKERAERAAREGVIK